MCSEVKFQFASPFSPIFADNQKKVFESNKLYNLYAEKKDYFKPKSQKV